MGSHPPKGRVIRARWKAVRNYWKGGSRANQYLASLGWLVAGNSKVFFEVHRLGIPRVPNTTKEDTSVLKRILAVALAAAMILGLAGVAFAASPFPDTAGIEEEETIALLKTLGLVKGDDLGYFNPEDTITRAEFCAMIVRALGLEAAAGYLATPTIFPDVTAAQAWAYGYINVATTRGIIKGYTDGTFRPQGPVTQAEALTMVMRALGYKDSLPGDWPLDYIMAGAVDTVGLVEAGFVPNASATRAFVANMIGTLLDCELVTEDKDNPGEFKGTDDVFGETKLGIEAGPSGMVTAVSTKDKTITIGTAHGYDAAVAVFGRVSTVSELKGYEVTTVLNSKGKIIFVSTEGIEYITGKITAVKVSDGTFTLGGTEYEADDDLAATKNGMELTGSLANKLVALVDATANVWLNDDGEAYRIEARMLDNTEEVISKKTVAVTLDGTVYKLTFGGPDIPLADEVTITRNGLPAGWADLKKGDTCDYALEDGEIVWLDAWNQVVEGVQVTARYDLGSKNKQIVALVNGVSTTYQCTADGFAAVDSVNTYWDLYIDRDGKVYAADEVTSEVLAVHGTIAGISIETTVVSGAAKTAYKVLLSDGSSILVPFDDGVDVYKNKEELTIGALPGWFSTTFKVGDGISADRVASGAVTEVRLYSTDFAGVLEAVDSNTFTIDDGEEIDLASGAKVTLNGVTATLAEIELAGAKARVTWDVEDGTATKVEGYEFCNTVETAISGIAETDGAYYFTTVDGHDIDSSKNAIVYKDGVAAKLSDVELGDKVMYECDGEYLEVTSDTDAPEVEDLGVFVYGDTLYVDVEFDEEVQAPTIWVAGEKFVLDADGDTGDFISWSLTLTMSEDLDEVLEAGDKVAIAITAKDYAGNVLNDTDMVTVEED